GDVPDHGRGHGRQCSVNSMEPSSRASGVRLLHDDDRDRYVALDGDEVVGVLYYGDEPSEEPTVRDLRSTVVAPSATARASAPPWCASPWTTSAGAGSWLDPPAGSCGAGSSVTASTPTCSPSRRVSGRRPIEPA